MQVSYTQDNHSQSDTHRQFNLQANYTQDNYLAPSARSYPFSTLSTFVPLQHVRTPSARSRPFSTFGPLQHAQQAMLVVHRTTAWHLTPVVHWTTARGKGLTSNARITMKRAPFIGKPASLVALKTLTTNKNKAYISQLIRTQLTESFIQSGRSSFNSHSSMFDNCR